MAFFKRKEKTTDSPGNRLEYKIDGQHTVVFNHKNLLPVVIQNESTREVLHLGYMDRQALQNTLQRAVVFLYRRSTGQLELFGSKNNLEYKIKTVKLDKSHRSLLLLVEPVHPYQMPATDKSSYTYKIDMEESNKY